jgi:hypothetical protein
MVLLDALSVEQHREARREGVLDLTTDPTQSGGDRDDL